MYVRRGKLTKGGNYCFVDQEKVPVEIGFPEGVKPSDFFSAECLLFFIENHKKPNTPTVKVYEQPKGRNKNHE